MLTADFMEAELQWYTYHVGLNVVVLLQALYIFKEVDFNRTCTKAISLVLLVVSFWFLFDYLAASILEIR